MGTQNILTVKNFRHSEFRNAGQSINSGTISNSGMRRCKSDNIDSESN